MRSRDSATVAFWLIGASCAAFVMLSVLVTHAWLQSIAWREAALSAQQFNSCGFFAQESPTGLAASFRRVFFYATDSTPTTASFVQGNYILSQSRGRLIPGTDLRFPAVSDWSISNTLALVLFASASTLFFASSRILPAVRFVALIGFAPLIAFPGWLFLFPSSILDASTPDRITPPTAWLICMAGVLFIPALTGWIASKSRATSPACCAICGYEAGSLSKCPECGGARSFNIARPRHTSSRMPSRTSSVGIRPFFRIMLFIPLVTFALVSFSMNWPLRLRSGFEIVRNNLSFRVLRWHYPATAPENTVVMPLNSAAYVVTRSTQYFIAHRLVGSTANTIGGRQGPYDILIVFVCDHMGTTSLLHVWSLHSALNNSVLSKCFPGTNASPLQNATLAISPPALVSFGSKTSCLAVHLDSAIVYGQAIHTAEPPIAWPADPLLSWPPACDALSKAIDDFLVIEVRNSRP